MDRHYNQKMLSKGTFRNLYVYGYDTPEGYAIEKDGKMYYAFFAPSAAPWKGEIELRGLTPGSYHVRAYAEDKDLGTVEATAGAAPRLKTESKTICCWKWQSRCVGRAPSPAALDSSSLTARTQKPESKAAGEGARPTPALFSVIAQEALAILLVTEGFGAARPGHGKSAGAVTAGQACRQI